MNSGHFKFFLHVVSPASCHPVRTFSSSRAPFFAVRQQTLSAISKCTLALACREALEMHDMLRSAWSLLYPKGHGKLRHLLLSVLELAVTDGVWKIVVKHATKREPCSRFLPYPAAPKLSLSSSKTLFPYPEPKLPMKLPSVQLRTKSLCAQMGICGFPDLRWSF